MSISDKTCFNDCYLQELNCTCRKFQKRANQTRDELSEIVIKKFIDVFDRKLANNYSLITLTNPLSFGGSDDSHKVNG